MDSRATFVFIASPVGADKALAATRVDEAAKFAAWVKDMEGGNPFPAAVVDYHTNKYITKPKSYGWWNENMRVYMEQVDACYVLCLEGWESSKGTAEEAAVAKECGKPVYHYKKTQDGYQRQ